MYEFQNIVIMGTVTKEVKYSINNKHYYSGIVSVTHDTGYKKKTDFFPVVAFGVIADIMHNIKIGTRVVMALEYDTSKFIPNNGGKETYNNNFIVKSVSELKNQNEEYANAVRKALEDTKKEENKTKYGLVTNTDLLNM